MVHLHNHTSSNHVEKHRFGYLKKTYENRYGTSLPYVGLCFHPLRSYLWGAVPYVLTFWGQKYNALRYEMKSHHGISPFAGFVRVSSNCLKHPNNPKRHGKKRNWCQPPIPPPSMEPIIAPTFASWLALQRGISRWQRWI